MRQLTMHPMTKKGGLLAAAVAAALLAACATPPNAALDDARAAYARAASDPAVASAAPNELTTAREQLDLAGRAYDKGEKPAVVDHYAYLARQRTQAAVEAGQTARANQATANAQVQRDQLISNARANQAQAQAAVAQAQAAQAQADASAANQRADALASELANAKQTDRGMVITLGDVLFDTGRDTLKSSAGRTIDEVSTFLMAHPERRVLIEGYTDSTGGDATNQALSQRRADAVRQALLGRGVPNERIQTRGLGEQYPVASNDSAAGRQLNRRVEVVFSTPAGTFPSPRS